jgi:His/Glu/Gln/Arg/opine family amino acid ABC transporter permease subunit
VSWHDSQLVDYAPLLYQGAKVTLRLTGLALLFGSVLGLLAGLARSSRAPWLRLPAMMFIGTFRSIPILLQLFFAYYALPLLFHIDVPQYAAATIALSVYCGAYMAEVVRSAVESIDRGQLAGSAALGLGRVRTFTYVIWPQALRVGLPAAVGVFVMTLKDSSLASVIGYLELTGTGLAVREIDPASGSFSVLMGVGAIYFLFAWLISLCGQLLERRLRIPGMAPVRARPAMTAA